MVVVTKRQHSKVYCQWDSEWCTGGVMGSRFLPKRGIPSHHGLQGRKKKWLFLPHVVCHAFPMHSRDNIMKPTPGTTWRALERTQMSTLRSAKTSAAEPPGHPVTKKGSSSQDGWSEVNISIKITAKKISEEWRANISGCSMMARQGPKANREPRPRSVSYEMPRTAVKNLTGLKMFPSPQRLKVILIL